MKTGLRFFPDKYYFCISITHLYNFFIHNQSKKGNAYDHVQKFQNLPVAYFIRICFFADELQIRQRK